MPSLYENKQFHKLKYRFFSDNKQLFIKLINNILRSKFNAEEKTDE